jgi:hypothetical protein
VADTDLQAAVREKYGEIAKSVGNTNCCGPTACGGGDPITSSLYSDQETQDLPAEALAASLLKNAGFSDVEVEPWRVYKLDDARAFLSKSGVDVDRVAPQVTGRFASAFVRARKPAAKSCCGPECCA